MKYLGLIIGLEENRAVVLTADSKVLGIKKSDSMFLGQKVFFSYNDILNIKRRRINNFVPAMAGIAALLMLVFGCLKFFYSSKTIIFIDVDINPSIEFAVDSESLVKDIHPINEDADVLTRNITLKNIPFTEALKKYIDKAIEKGYLNANNENSNYMLVSAALNTKSSEYKKNRINTEKILESELESLKYKLHEVYGQKFNFQIVKVPEIYKEKSAENNISMGKYMVYEKIKEKRVPITSEQLILNSGNNTITYKYDTGDSGWINLDYIIINSSLSTTSTPTTTSITPPTETPATSINPTSTQTPDVPIRSAYTKIEAESFNSKFGEVKAEACGEGTQNLGYIKNGDYVVYSNIDFGSGADSIQARVASTVDTGKIYVRLDTPTGTQIGTITVPNTGNSQTYTSINSTTNRVSGVHDLYLVFEAWSNINWFQFSPSTSTPATTSTSTPTSNPTSTPKSGKSLDVNNDGAINMSDVMLVAGVFNSVSSDSRYVSAYDFNNDGVVNMSDIMLIAAKFNTIV